MAKSNFEDMLEKERNRLTDLRQDAMTRRSAIDSEIADLDREMSAIDAYERAKNNKRKTGTRAPRSDGRRASVLKLIQESPTGLNRSDILSGLGVKGDKSGEQSVSNALSILKKQNKVTAANGIYKYV